MTDLWDGSYPPSILFPEPPGPTVTSITPASGPVSGGQAVTIAGTNLLGATGGILSPGYNLLNFVVVNATTITATTPEALGGPIVSGLVVTFPDGVYVQLAAGYEYVAGETGTAAPSTLAGEDAVASGKPRRRRARTEELEQDAESP